MPQTFASRPVLNDLAPRWMKACLVAAGLYNIAWGFVTVVAPVWSLERLGVSAPDVRLRPQFWACIGMIVGVYGIGYLIASRNPARHWPIVLVGLVGKILGPIGFVGAALKGQLPWSLSLTILPNDLLWWIPFAMILWHAARESQPAPPLGSVELPAALDALSDDQGRSLRHLSQDRPTLIVLLRHTGCTFCKQTLSDLARWQGAIAESNLHLAVVAMAPSAADVRALAREYGVTRVHCFADPDRLLYRALELKRGGFLQLFGPRVILAGLRAFAQGHGIGKLESDGFQLSGAFVVYREKILRAYRHETAADRPDLHVFACSISEQ